MAIISKLPQWLTLFLYMFEGAYFYNDRENCVICVCSTILQYFRSSSMWAVSWQLCASAKSTRALDLGWECTCYLAQSVCWCTCTLVHQKKSCYGVFIQLINWGSCNWPVRQWLARRKNGWKSANAQNGDVLIYISVMPKELELCKTVLWQQCWQKRVALYVSEHLVALQTQDLMKSMGFQRFSFFSRTLLDRLLTHFVAIVLASSSNKKITNKNRMQNGETCSEGYTPGWGLHPWLKELFCFSIFVNEIHCCTYTMWLLSVFKRLQKSSPPSAWELIP